MQMNSCYNCSRDVEKDVKALNKKLLGRSTRQFLCIVCLAEYLGCTEGTLRDKIRELKEQGCKLFA